MGSSDTEACGRCGMTTVVSATEDGEGEGDADVFDGGRIEVAEADLRTVAWPARLLGRAKRTLDDVAMRLTYDR